MESPMLMAVTGIFIFTFGLLVGSFLNVCIVRFPKGESVITPGSHCVHCGKSIAWYDNIPLLSYLILSGKCRNCKKKISFRYFLVELLSGLMWFLLWDCFGISPLFVAGVVLYSILLAVAVTDLETGIIPDKLTLPGMFLGLAISTIMPLVQNEVLWYRGLMQSALGFLAGGGILLVTGFLGNWIFKKEAMGGGDIKLLAMIGAFLGLNDVVLVFLFSPVIAVPFALYAKTVHKSETIPFGPFLALTGAVFFIFGEKILSSFFLTFGA